MMKVGQEIFKRLQELEELIPSGSEGKLRLRFGGFWIDSEKIWGESYETVLPLMDSLKEAGFIEARVERDRHEVTRIFTHPSLDEHTDIKVKHSASERDAIQGLEEKKAELQKQIDSLELKMAEVAR